MKGKKLLAGIMSAAMVLCTMAIPAFADESTISSVNVKGVAGFEDKTYSTIQEAYAAISPEVDKLAGLEQNPSNDEAFNALYTDKGKITWTIKGKQTYSENDNKFLFSLGRAAARYNDNCYITDIDIIGGDDTAELVLEKNVTVPYDWWKGSTHLVSISFSKLKITAGENLDSISTGFHGDWGYNLKVKYQDCKISGKFYLYRQAGSLDLNFDNCTFDAPENAQYAIFAQGETSYGTVTVNQCNFNNYTRGVNFQIPSMDFKFTNNTIKSNVSEPDRGAVQITDGVSFVVTGNTIDVNGGNAFWFHKAATNENAKYTISNNDIKAPYLVNDDTTFGVNNKITACNNVFNDTDIENCMEKEAATPTKSTVTAIAANGWESDTDSGYYMVGETKYGMMRFMFKTEPTGTVTASGIKYINAKDISKSVTANTAAGATVFQGDVVKVDEGTEGTYYARAYITTKDGTTFWSAPVGCSVNWNRFFTKYTGGVQ